MNTVFLQELLNAVAEQGRQLLPWGLGGDRDQDIQDLSRALVSSRGEASGVALAQQLLARYRGLPTEDRAAFFRFLAESFKPEPDSVNKAVQAYLQVPSDVALARLQAAVESPRQEFFRRLNLAPGATAEIVAMRRDLLTVLAHDRKLTFVDADLRHLFSSWFNRGFLVARRIDWQTPAAILEKIIAYEAVHEIEGWDDLRRRLDPADRRCFAFFHPSLVDEPLIFVEVALMNQTPHAISTVLREERKSGVAAVAPTTAVFYSISNCQEGLKGISFGNFLIKQVVEELVKEKPSLKRFVTLSPVPNFAGWLAHALDNGAGSPVTAEQREVLKALQIPDWHTQADDDGALKASLLSLAVHYFLVARSGDGRTVDPVARFHLGNGARLEHINWLGDTSAKALREAHGLMVNYRYDPREIEKNHEAYANEGAVAVSRSVRAMLRPEHKKGLGIEKSKALPAPAAEEPVPVSSAK